MSDETYEMKSKNDEIHACGNCGKNGVTKRCNGCKITYYCDQTCQRNNWKQHKKQCKLYKKQCKLYKKQDVNTNDTKTKSIQVIQPNCIDFNTFLVTFVQELGFRYNCVFFSSYELDESNKAKIELAHANARNINAGHVIESLRDARSKMNLINNDCIEFTDKMLWFVVDILVGMNVAVYRRNVMLNNNINIETIATEFLKQCNPVKPPKRETQQKGIPIPMVTYLAMNYINNSWHSYFKKDGNIWCIEDCIDTFIKHSNILNVKCAFGHAWKLYCVFNSIFLDKLYKDKYPCVKITNADEFRAFCQLVIGTESEDSLRSKIEYVWRQQKCDANECEGVQEYDGTDYFSMQLH